MNQPRSRSPFAPSLLVPLVLLAAGPALPQEGVLLARAARALAHAYGDEAAEALARRFGPRAAEVFARHGDEGVRVLERLGPELAGKLPESCDDLVRAVARHGDAAVEVLRQGGPEALRVVAALDGPGLRFAQVAGADAGEVFARGGARGVLQALRNPEYLEAFREARRVGRLAAFLEGARVHGDRFVAWIGRRWKEVGFIAALATFVAVAPNAVEQAGATARAGVRELGSGGTLAAVGLALAAAVAWDLLRRRGSRIQNPLSYP